MPTLPEKPNTVVAGARPSGPKPPAPPPLPSLTEPEDRTPGWEVVAMAAIALFLMTACWFVPRPTGDLYVALAGARDVFDGKLGDPNAPLVKALGAVGIHTGGPDDWSFDEPRPVWMNQNWGTHLLFYGAWTVFGPNGVPGLKAVLMLTMGAVIVLACRQHRIRWPVCLLMGSCAVIGGNAYIDLRPNIILLTLAPMMYWLLVRSRRNPHRIWWAAVLMLFWGNMHGSFIFGLAMMGLWAACVALPAIAAEGWGNAFRRWWPVAVAPVVGLFVTTVLSPFGFGNVTHPLIMGKEEEWRQVAEWMPVLPPHHVDYGSTGEFFIAMGVLALLAAARPLANVVAGKKKLGLVNPVLVTFSLIVSLCVTWASFNAYTAAGKTIRALQWSGGPEPAIQEATGLQSGAVAPMIVFLLIAALGAYAAFRVLAQMASADDTGRDASPPPARKEDASLLFFSVILSGIVLAMAFTSRRFVTLSLGLVAPLLGAQLDWLFRQAQRVPFFRLARPAVLAGALVLPFASALLARSLPHYAPENPTFMPQLNTVFDRMTDNEAYIHGGADFLAMNQVRGNAVQEWRWEGFLHWKCPLMKIYVGGRAQQAYGLAPYERRMKIWGAGYKVPTQPNAAAWQEQVSLRLRDDLRELKVNYVVAPQDQSSEEILTLLLTPNSPWTMIYYDRENVILANSEDPQVQALIDNVVSGQAKFPDYIPGVAAASKAMCMGFLPGKYSAEARRLAIEQANREMPSAECLNKILQMQGAGEVSLEYVAQYLTSLFQEISKVHKNPYEDFKLLLVRVDIARLMTNMAARNPQLIRNGAEWQREAADLQAQFQQEAVRWR
jgi:hypothetical protein